MKCTVSYSYKQDWIDASTYQVLLRADGGGGDWDRYLVGTTAICASVGHVCLWLRTREHERKVDRLLRRYIGYWLGLLECIVKHAKQACMSKSRMRLCAVDVTSAV